ncbi:amidohydrolase [Arthrobacter sedimenti]|uniref:amidohydrolase n=1 Tax=Arthrobacter sedimenti TaxID=2694931 RepID=UPI000B3612DF|nr:amidohydrolase [Arthrobacter sedimenti]OUM43822.1 amidohydrolase [Arthrobacter agilis]
MAATLYCRGRIHALDRAAVPADTLLAEDGVIVAIGDDRAVRRSLTGPAEEFDLEGRSVIPGLIDAHIHSATFARDRTTVDLRGVTDLEEAVERVRRHAETLAPGQWLFGGRWDFNTWTVPLQPDRHSLDSVCPDRPVALPSIDGHTIWANSLALRAIGVTAATPDPIGGEIVRDERGDPTGILRESARQPLRDLMNSELSGDLVSQLRAAQEHFLSLGLTGLHDMDAEDSRAAYLSLHEAGELKLRVHKSIPMNYLDGAIAEGRYTGQGDDWFTTGALKLFSDGALGSHTALMSEPFPGEPHNHGIEVIPYRNLVELMGKAARTGIAVATHAIGDRANHLVLNAYEELLPITRERGLRHRIEHAQHLLPSDVVRFAELGVIPSMQPTHCTSDIPLSGAMLHGRSLANYAWRSLLDTGAALAFGSDAPVESPNPVYGLHAALTRQNEHGEPPAGWEPEQRLSLVEALEGFTSGPAFAAGQEAKLGRLRPGMLADFAVLNEDPFSIAPDELRHLEVQTTVVGGEVRFQRTGATSRLE